MLSSPRVPVALTGALCASMRQAAVDVADGHLADGEVNRGTVAGRKLDPQVGGRLETVSRADDSDPVSVVVVVMAVVIVVVVPVVEVAVTEGAVVPNLQVGR